MHGKFETAGPKVPSRATVTGGLVAMALAVMAGAVGAVGADGAPSTCANEDLRKGPAAFLPDCRAYEQVSPANKNGGDVLINITESGEEVEAFSVAVDGERAMFGATTEFAGAEHGGGVVPTPYVSQRGAGGWTTDAMFPPVTPAASEVQVAMSASDLRRSLLTASGALRSNPPDPSPDPFNIYSRDNLLGTVSPFVGISADPGASNFQFVAPAASEDASHLVFATVDQLTDEPVPGGLTLKVYERVADELRLVSVRPDGTPFDNAAPGHHRQFGGSSYSTVGAVSNDGEHIFFNNSAAPGEPEEIYRRSYGTTTVPASPSQRSPADPEGVKTKIFRLASTDGGRVLFTSSELLTNDANTGALREGTDLYRYDVDANELIDISATAGGNGARVEGVIGADDAAERVYYVAHGQVVPGAGADNSTADPGTERPNLYLWEDDGTPNGKTRFIATLSGVDSRAWRDLNEDWTARVTSDGGTLVFESETSIPGHDNGGVRQIYHYDADALDGAGRLSCVSCNPNGDSPLGPATVPSNQAGSRTQRWEHPNALSDDGRRVFFNTHDSLVPRDSNGENDAYLWQEGEVMLLTSGTAERGSFFYNASKSGDDAFVVTAEALVPQDIDDLPDLYDVRVGGGIPVQTMPACADDECQGTGSAIPPAGDTGSNRLRGAGNVDAGGRVSLTVRRLSKAQRRKLARGRRVGVRVRVSRPMTVRVALRIKTRSGSKVVAQGSARARKAGRVVVRLRLSSFAQRRLRATGAIRLSLQARAAGARSQSLTVRLRKTR